VKYAQEAEGYAEYALFATGVQADPATMVDLLDYWSRRLRRASIWTTVTSLPGALHTAGKDEAVPAIVEKPW